MKLGYVMKFVKRIDGYIQDIRRNMVHASSYGVDILRHYVTELENVKESILNGELVSNKDLEYLTTKYRECLRYCLQANYAGKPQVLGVPANDPWTPPEIPVTVTAVNIIMYIDLSDSMFDWGGLKYNGRTRNLLQAFATEIATRAAKEQVPTKVSLVGFADPTDKYGKNRPTFWEIVLNKSSNVSALASAIGNINKNKWVNGLSPQEEGMTAIYKTIDTVVDKSIVDGKPTENIVILVSDERQRYRPHLNSHKNYTGTVTETQFKNKMASLGIKNIFGMLPFKKGYSYDKYYNSTGVYGGKNWNSYLRSSFRSTKEFWDTKTMANLQDWVKWSLDPDSFGS